MQAEIIAIGDELLIGQTVDTNSTFIAAQLNQIGVHVYQKRAIADKEELIKLALDTLHKNTSIVIMTGGLGPTNDDITKKTLNEYFGGELMLDQIVFENIARLYESFNRPPDEVQRQQALLPNNCKALINDLGTASGMHFTNSHVHYFSLPGVPYEAEHLIVDRIIPWISANLNAGSVVHKTLLTQGVAESELASKLVEFEKGLPENISLAYLPSPGMVKLRLSSYKGDSLIAASVIDKLGIQLKERLGNVIYGENAESLEQLVGQLLTKDSKSISLAESCTGGQIASLVTSVPGSSQYFKGSIVSYFESVKSEVLGISSQLIAEHGVVSEEVAIAMAEASRKLFKTDYAISTTGISGPDGGSLEIPVGSVWIAISSEKRSKAWFFRFGNNRERNNRKAAVTALNLLRREIQKSMT